MIDILIPVLGRPHNAGPLVQNIRDTTEVPAKVVFLCSRGDHPQIDACLATDAHTLTMEFAAGRGDYARKINYGFNITGAAWEPGEFVFMAADDLRFEPRWDTAALKAAGTRHGVVGTNDMANAKSNADSSAPTA